MYPGDHKLLSKPFINKISTNKKMESLISKVKTTLILCKINFIVIADKIVKHQEVKIMVNLYVKLMI